MGISKRVCSANKIEIKELRNKITKMSSWKYLFPEQLTKSRRLDFTIRMSEMTERIDYLKRDKHANLRKELQEGEEPNFDFKYILKKTNVKNRTQIKTK